MPYDTAPSAPIIDHREPRQMLKLNVRMPDGGWTAPPAPAGTLIIEALERFGLPLRRSSNAIRIGAHWRPRVASLSEGAQAAGCLANGTLPLSLVMTAELDGLEIELGWDALEPQTYWTAG